MSQDTQPAAAVRADEPYRFRWLAFAVVLLAAMMDLLDVLVTNIAGPSIREDIGGGTTLLQWLGAGYTLAMFAGLIIGGRLGDIYGRRRVFLVGAVGFTVASVLCSVSTEPGMLLTFRVLQGAFGAVMLPQGLGIIREVFPPRELAAAFGAFGPAMGLSTVAGPTLAGWLIDADLFGTGWRMIFLVNLPLGLVAIAGAVRFVPRTAGGTARRLDPLGAVLATVAALLIIYPVVQGRELDWPAWTFVSMAGSVALFGVFGWHVRRVDRAGGEPLVPPSLFTKQAFVGGLVAGLFFFTAIVGFSLVLTVYLQIGLGFSPLKAGLTALPQALGSVAGFVAAGAGLTARYGRMLLHVGTLLMAAGVLGVALTISVVDGAVSPWHLVPALAVSGVGLGLVLAPFFDIVLAGVEDHETGSASGTLTAMQQFGGALGVAVMGTVFFGVLGGNIADGGDTSALRGELAAAGVPTAMQDQVVVDLRACGRDRAESDDPTVPPNSCTRLTGTVADAAQAADDEERVTTAVGQAREQAGDDGFDRSLQQVLWVVAGLQVITCALGLLLPRRARPEWGPDQVPEGVAAA